DAAAAEVAPAVLDTDAATLPSGGTAAAPASAAPVPQLAELPARLPKPAGPEAPPAWPEPAAAAPDTLPPPPAPPLVAATPEAMPLRHEVLAVPKPSAFDIAAEQAEATAPGDGDKVATTLSAPDEPAEAPV